MSTTAWRLLPALAVLIIGGCAGLTISELDTRYGSPDPARYDDPAPTHGTVDFWAEVNPVLERRCVVCHACYDAACQLKLSSFEGLARGATTVKVYDGDRPLAAAPTRLFEDAQRTSTWRDMGFSPVLNEREDTPEANIAGSVMAQMLLLKQAHPLPDGPTLPETFDFSLDREQQCTAIEEFDDFRADFPLWGMPYGLPAIPAAEQQTLLRWIEQGAPYAPRKPLSAPLRDRVDRWEAFFNQSSLKGRLAARYMYEHLFQAHLHFPDAGAPMFFELVRSATPPGQAIERISTRVPFLDPGVERVYYRLQPVRESISIKNHMPYRLDDKRLNRWRQLFFASDYEVTALPGYEVETASSPFLTYRELPVRIRYSFMLEEAQFTIMGFIKGPVCRGQTALNVINDHFWVVFADPDVRLAPAHNEAIARSLESMAMPASARSTAAPLNWLAHAKQEKRYRDLRDRLLSETTSDEVPFNLDVLWDGEGHNDNAALTVFRHFDSASVEKGLLGGTPQTAWVVDYPLLERIHYLLVAGYDVYGNLGHQLNTRIYMDFLRMEGESNFIALLPKAARAATQKHWYRGDVSRLVPYLNQEAARLDRESTIEYQTGDPLHELYGLLRQRMAPVLDRRHELDMNDYEPTMGTALRRLDASTGGHLALLPETTFLIVEQAGMPPLSFTLIHNRAHSNISHMFGETDRRLPLEDTLTLTPGFVGAYPNALLRLKSHEISEFADWIDGLVTEADYQALMTRFGVRRTDPGFWQLSDLLHAKIRAESPVAGGLLDYNRLENR